MVNRDRHDITMELLKKAASGKRKTELMRDVGLSYLQAKQYLSALTRKGLLEMDKQNRFKRQRKAWKF